jgi:hypothetical protein
MKKLISTLKAKLSSTPTLTTPPSFIHPTSFPGPAEDSTLEILYEGEIPAIEYLPRQQSPLSLIILTSNSAS